LHTTIHSLKKGEQAIIKDFDIDAVPLKLLEMGCLPGNLVELLQIAPFGDPLYLNINGSHVAIRVETAKEIEVDIIKTNLW
jgi:ferrous iron transport protein A